MGSVTLNRIPDSVLDEMCEIVGSRYTEDKIREWATHPATIGSTRLEQVEQLARILLKTAYDEGEAIGAIRCLLEIC